MDYLIDTCVWIEVERGRLAPSDVARQTGKGAVYLSPITISELQYGVEMAQSAAVRLERQRAVDLLKRKPLILIDEETGAIHGRLCAELRKQGRESRYRLMDLWLAAQALQHNLCLYTLNTKDFIDIPGLRLASLLRA